MVKIEVVRQSRLNGVDVQPGAVVELEPSLASAWMKAGRARAARADGTPEAEKTDLKKLSIKKLKILAEEKGVELPDTNISKQDLKQINASTSSILRMPP